MTTDEMLHYGLRKMHLTQLFFGGEMPPRFSVVFDAASGTHAAFADDGRISTGQEPVPGRTVDTDAAVTSSLNPDGPCAVCRAAPLSESCLVLVRGVPAVACPSCWEEAASHAG